MICYASLWLFIDQSSKSESQSDKVHGWLIHSFHVVMYFTKRHKETLRMWPCSKMIQYPWFYCNFCSRTRCIDQLLTRLESMAVPHQEEPLLRFHSVHEGHLESCSMEAGNLSLRQGDLLTWLEPRPFHRNRLRSSYNIMLLIFSLTWPEFSLYATTLCTSSWSRWKGLSVRFPATYVLTPGTGLSVPFQNG
jgi:hypothetical protein